MKTKVILFVMALVCLCVPAQAQDKPLSNICISTGPVNFQVTVFRRIENSTKHIVRAYALGILHGDIYATSNADLARFTVSGACDHLTARKLLDINFAALRSLGYTPSQVEPIAKMFYTYKFD